MSEHKLPSDFPREDLAIYGETPARSMLFGKPRATIPQTNANIDANLTGTLEQKRDAVMSKIQHDLRENDDASCAFAAALTVWMVWNDPEFNDRREAMTWIGFIATNRGIYITCGVNDTDHAEFRQMVEATNEMEQATVH